MAYYKDPVYQREARRAVIELGHYFTARLRLRKALDLPPGAPGRWFEGSLPAPSALARIQTFLHLAAQVDELSGDRVATGRFFARYRFTGAVLDDPALEVEILERARFYFRNGVPPLPARSQWQAPLTAKHPKLLELEPYASAGAAETGALAGLLGELAEGQSSWR